MKMKLLSLAAAALMLVGANNASAQLSLTVLANPWTPAYFAAGGLTGATSGTVTYTVTNTSGGIDPAALDRFRLNFLSSAFDLSPVPPTATFKLVSALIGVSDYKSDFSWVPFLSGYRLSGNLSTDLLPGQVLTLTVMYELNLPANSVSWGTFMGSPLGPWEQGYTGDSPDDVPYVTNGHTILVRPPAHTPEPSTIILLGSGLLGTGLVTHLRQRRNAKA